MLRSGGGHLADKLPCSAAFFPFLNQAIQRPVIGFWLLNEWEKHEFPALSSQSKTHKKSIRHTSGCLGITIKYPGESHRLSVLAPGLTQCLQATRII